MPSQTKSAHKATKSKSSLKKKTSEPGTSHASQKDGKGKEEQENETPKGTVLEMHGYRVGKTLGQGSYATVKEAYSQRHKSIVAVKVISKRRAPADYLEKFLPREIEVVKLLKHPNLVLFLQSIETNNRVYLVMENATGGDLLEVVRNRKVIPEKQAGFWFSQMVEGIEYCHSKGVVHRDLKCENVLLDENMNIKITDFGFARSNMMSVNGSFTMSETYCGSYAYAAPEILTGTPYIPQMSDIWSLGVILYVMALGRLPFDDSNHKNLLKQTQRGPVFHDPKPISSDCCDIIKGILSKKDTRMNFDQIRKHRWFRKVTRSKSKSNEVVAESRPGTADTGKRGFFGKLFKGTESSKESSSKDQT